MAGRADEQVAAIVRWYGSHARDLPWRAATAGAWAVLVSEVMLQQTPVARVLPAYQAWLARWPTAASLAAASPADAVRQWGRLGYPRRALRLHETAPGSSASGTAGRCPARWTRCSPCPASAPTPRRRWRASPSASGMPCWTRTCAGCWPGWPRASNGQHAATTAAEVALAARCCPARPGLAARWSVAVMELGALVCTAARPRCDSCPVAAECAWRLAGCPAAPGRRASQPYEGTDRQCRGRLLAVLRDSGAPVPATRLDAAWPDPVQRARALASLVADGLAEPCGDGRSCCPGTPSTVATPASAAARPGTAARA